MGTSPRKTTTRPREKPIHVRAPRSLHTALRARARVEDRSMAEIVRSSIREYLEVREA